MIILRQDSGLLSFICVERLRITLSLIIVDIGADGNMGPQKERRVQKTVQGPYLYAINNNKQ